MNQYLNPKVSSITDAVLSLTAALLQIKAPVGQRVQVIKHVHERRPLVELRVVRDDDKETADYGVRQAWIYAYPDEGLFELRYTLREDIIAAMKSNPPSAYTALVFGTDRKEIGRFELEDIFNASQILHLYLTDPTDVIPATAVCRETDLPPRND